MSYAATNSPSPSSVNAVEVLANQFECPKVFIDAELVGVK